MAPDLSIDDHSTRHWPMRQIGHLGHIRLFVLAFESLFCNVPFEAFVEVVGTHACVDDGEEDQNDGDDGEGG